MKRQTLLVVAATAAIFTPLAFTQSGGGLVRVQPEEGAGQLEPFQSETWRSALTETNLELRERDFDRLIELAQRDDEAWSFLKELSEDPAGGELCWTARLALRELNRAPRNTFFQPLAGPDVRLSDPFSGIEEMLQEMGVGGMVFPGRQHLDGQSEDRRVEIQNDGQKWYVRIKARENGEESVREYEGDSLEAILEANPELNDELGVSHLGGLPDGFRMNLGLPLRSPLGEIIRDLEGFRQGIPSQGFNLQHGQGQPGRFRVFLSPQAHSQPLRTDVLGVRVTPISLDHSAELGLEESVGLYVQGTFPGTIAHLVGVHGGDVLIELNGTTLSAVEDITAQMEARAEKDSVRLVWIDASGVRQDRGWYPDGKGPSEDF